MFFWMENRNGESTANEYTYDNHGNLAKDSNKDISTIAYNCLNLPDKVTFSDGSTITYSYAADGTKGRNAVKKTICGVNLLSSIYLGFGKEDIYTPYGNTYEKAGAKITGDVDYKSGDSLALLMGIDFEIDWSQVLDAIITLFK